MPYRTAVVSASQGKEFATIKNITFPLLNLYAKRCDSDFIDLASHSPATSHPHLVKFFIYDLFDRYDRITFLDCDILVRKDCPSLFDVVPQEKVGVWFETLEPNYRITAAQEAYGSLPHWKAGYFNSGVIVASKPHVELFSRNPAPEIKTKSEFDQPLLNWRVQQLRLPLCKLPRDFNHTVWHCDSRRFKAYLIHHVGAGKPSYLSRVNRLRRDNLILKLPKSWWVPVGEIVGWFDRRITEIQNLPRTIYRKLRSILRGDRQKPSL